MDLMNWINNKIYEDWITQNITLEDAYENCAFWSLVMSRDFPELTIIKGSVQHPYSKCCYHEYLKTPTGEIVDPTRIQFDTMFGNNWKYLEEGL